LTTIEELKAKLSELINKAESLPEGPGKMITLSQLEGVRLKIETVIKRRELLETETNSLVEPKKTS
jgi:hypothetical protein